MKKYVFFVVALIALAGCGNSQKSGGQETAKAETSQVADNHSAETSLDYWGVYEGTLPAASGPGIKTKLSINKDSTFDIRLEYIGEKDGVFENKGTYTIDGNILTLTQKDGETSYYKIEEGQIRMLDADKQPITGDLEHYYIMRQTQMF